MIILAIVSFGKIQSARILADADKPLRILDMHRTTRMLQRRICKKSELKVDDNGQAINMPPNLEEKYDIPIPPLRIYA